MVIINQYSRLKAIILLQVQASNKQAMKIFRRFAVRLVLKRLIGARDIASDVGQLRERALAHLSSQSAPMQNIPKRMQLQTEC